MNTRGWPGALTAAAIGGVCSFTALKVGGSGLIGACIGFVLSALVVFFIAMYLTRRAQH